MMLRRPRADAFADDATALTELMIASRRATMPHLAEPRAPAEVHRWMRETVLPSRSVWIVEVAGEVVGFALRNGAWLDALYVTPG